MENNKTIDTIKWDELDKKKYFFFTPTLFLLSRAVVYPSNLVKTILQVNLLYIIIIILHLHYYYYYK